jgi:hypothetical protein
MSLINRITRLAGSPQGRRLLSRAGRYARSPQGRARLEHLRRQIAGRRTGRPR